ncbi:MAG: transporter [Epsilonproteobacteria bacterium (ex Lamellibrachia satsuma)]|nr:MAG: transporter [Epsilonproteobacteria bacterium (ex Lamellibrachia satsuma)]
MSSIIAAVSEIQSCDSLHIVTFDFHGQALSMMSLELSDTVKTGAKVRLAVKPSYIVIAKNFIGELSYSNRLESTVRSIENGQLLSSVKLNFFDTVLESIITVDASKKMDLKVGDEVTAFIKASELSISEVLDD